MPFVIVLGWMLSADKTALKGSKLHAQAAHVYPKVQALLSVMHLRWPDRATVDSGNSFPKQEVRPGGSTAQPMRVCRGN